MNFMSAVHQVIGKYDESNTICFTFFLKAGTPQQLPDNIISFDAEHARIVGGCKSNIRQK